MGIFFPERLLDRILAETDIVELVSSYFPLKKAGRNFRALCPFHDEKTPSFMVNREKQMFKCFGCGKGGNAFHFLMEKERVPFQEAVATLARKANIPLPERKGDGPKRQVRDEMFAAMSYATSFYRDRLRKAEGEVARDYLRERGIADETAEKFCLGFAPGGWETFLNGASRKFRPSVLEEVGLILPRENSPGYYDRFRNRLMFPIFDPRGRVIGFSGRILPGSGEEESGAKYVNSPESPLFNKSSVLYGLNFSRSEIAKQDKAIVCEGHLDLIAIDQAGFGTAVAVQGTAFTRTQAKLLKRYCAEVIFAFDSDSAGEDATLRSFEPLMEVELDVRVTVMPPGYDPDLLIREKGKDEFQGLLDGAVELVDFQYEVLRKKNDEKTLAGRRAIASQMLLSANRSPSAIVKEAWIQRISGAVGIPETALRAEMRRIRGNYRPFSKDAHATGEVRENFAEAERERDLIGSMLAYPEVRDLVAERLGVDDFKDVACKAVAASILSAREGGKKVSADTLLNQTNDAQEAELISRFVLEPIQSERPVKAATEAIERIAGRKRSQRIKELQEKIAQAQKEGGDWRSLQAECGGLLKAQDERVPAT